MNVKVLETEIHKLSKKAQLLSDKVLLEYKKWSRSAPYNDGQKKLINLLNYLSIMGMLDPMGIDAPSNINIKGSRGLTVIQDKNNKAKSILPNGKSSYTIKLWSGMKDFKEKIYPEALSENDSNFKEKFNAIKKEVKC